MFARVSTIFGEPDRVDAALAHIEDHDSRAVAAAAGNHGLSSFVDRTLGVIVVVSYWDEQGQSSDASLTEARGGAAIAAYGDLVTETYTVEAGRSGASARDGESVVRMARMQLTPARLPELVAHYRNEIVPQLDACDGLLSADLLLDDRLGNAVSLTVWRNEDAARAAGVTLARLRESTRYRLPVTFLRVEAYTVERATALSA